MRVESRTTVTYAWVVLHVCIAAGGERGWW